MTKTSDTQDREEQEPVKRLNIEVPKSLHTRVKAGCALNDKTITEVVVEMLKAKFPPTNGA
jgi:hypothetical protein